MGIAVFVGCGVRLSESDPSGGPNREVSIQKAGGRDAAALPLRAEETPTDGFRNVEGFGEEVLWVSNHGNYRCEGDCVAPQETFLRRLDPETREAYPAIPVKGEDVEIAFGAGSVWATSELGVLRIDPETDRVTRTIPLKYAGGATGVAFGEGAVWATGAGDGTVSRIDPQENRVIARIDVGDGRRGAAAKTVAVGAGSVWVGTRNGGLARIDPANKRVVGVTPIEKDVPDGKTGDVSDVSVGAGAVWVVGSYGDWTGGFEGKLTKVDPKTTEVVGEVPLDEGAHEVETTRGAVWATSSIDPGGPGGSTTAALSRVDPDENRVVGSLRADSLSGPAVGGGTVWAAEAEQGGPSALLGLAP